MKAQQKTIRVGINGFGRIGRSLYRLLLQHTGISVVVVNDIAPITTLVHLLKYDSIHGRLPYEVTHKEQTIHTKDTQTLFTQHTTIEACEWDKHHVDIVIEATGKFKSANQLQHHLKKGVQKVILSVPPLQEQNDEIKMIVMGINDHLLDGSERIISNASCTTNNAAPMVKIIDELCGIQQAYIPRCTVIQLIKVYTINRIGI